LTAPTSPHTPGKALVKELRKLQRISGLFTVKLSNAADTMIFDDYERAQAALSPAKLK
jgi:hypothetical protein